MQSVILKNFFKSSYFLTTTVLKHGATEITSWQCTFNERFTGPQRQAYALREQISEENKSGSATEAKNKNPCATLKTTADKKPKN